MSLLFLNQLKADDVCVVIYSSSSKYYKFVCLYTAMLLVPWMP